MRNPNWSEEELILAFNLYCKISFGKIHKNNPQIIQLAELIGRTPSAVGLKLSNLASFDPQLQARGIKGMKNAGKKDRLIFEKFQNDREGLIYQSEKILAEREGLSLENKYEAELPEANSLVGEMKERYVKTRVNQNFFRQMILTNYHSKCAVTGIDLPQLLIASHILPWAQNKAERLNPENGICLSALYDKAFDQHLISFDKEYRLILSTNLKEHCTKTYYQTHFGKLEGQELILPHKWLPKQEFLEWHREMTK